jgi:hypothetical protein
VVNQGVTGNGPGAVGQPGPAGITPVTTGQSVVPPAPPGWVHMKAPNGEVQLVPQETAGHYQSLGAVPLQGGASNPLFSNTQLPAPMPSPGLAPPAGGQ